MGFFLEIAFNSSALSLLRTLVWSRLIDIFLTGHDPGSESKVAAFKTLIRIAGRTQGATAGIHLGTPDSYG